MRSVWPKSIEKVNLIEPLKEMQRAGQSLLDSKLSSCLWLHNVIHTNLSNIALQARMSFRIKCKLLTCKNCYILHKFRGFCIYEIKLIELNC
jgi:hypothetical protein